MTEIADRNGHAPHAFGTFATELDHPRRFPAPPSRKANLDLPEAKMLLTAIVLSNWRWRRQDDMPKPSPPARRLRRGAIWDL